MKENRKKMVKLEYDIEQILQKHNQQIAKIAHLKENVAAGRADRVVFSKLFQKIEREIKHY